MERQCEREEGRLLMDGREEIKLTVLVGAI